MTHFFPSRRLRARVVALAAAASLAAGALQAQPAGRSALRNGDFIVAVVNSEAVTAVEVAQRLERITAEARRNGARLPDAETLRQQVLDALIDERVQVTYARETGQKIDDAELDRAVANVAAQNQITVPQLRERLRAEGMDYTRFRSNLKDQMLVERVREREVLSRIRVTDADIDQLLDEQRARNPGAEQLNLAQILVPVPENAPPDVVAQRKAVIDRAAARLAAGEDFSQVAREMSEDGNRAAGGVMGLRPADRYPDLFLDAVKGLQPGQHTTEPVRSAAGFHLVRLVERSGDAAAFRVQQTHARHILLRVSERAQAQSVARRLDALRQQIERGERRFDAVAQEISEDGSAAGGGDLGWASPGQFVPEFEDAMNQLKPGGISPPVLSRFGVHLIQVLERRTVALDPKEVREQARNQLREAKYEPAYLEWAKELRLRAYIEMREPPS